jgi:general secretion pathway protein N
MLTRVCAQTQPQTRTPQAKDQTQAQAATGPASPLAAYPLDRLSATRERPLFSPSRRPPAPPPAPVIAAAPPPPPPNLILFGIVMDAEEAHAVVGVGTADKTRRVRIGDDIGGWKVTQIEERQLVLSLDDRSATFTLFRGQRAGQGDSQPLSAPVRRRP